MYPDKSGSRLPLHMTFLLTEWRAPATFGSRTACYMMKTCRGPPNKLVQRVVDWASQMRSS
jgi:hypothetical protein